MPLASDSIFAYTQISHSAKPNVESGVTHVSPLSRHSLHSHPGSYCIVNNVGSWTCYSRSVVFVCPAWSWGRLNQIVCGNSSLLTFCCRCRVPELREFCAEHGLVLTSIQDLRCLIRERQRAGVLGGAAGADPTLSCMMAR